MRLVINNEDITNFYTEIKWSGEKGQAARSLEYGLVVSSTDVNLPKVTVPVNGTCILFNNDGKKIFEGMVLEKEKSISSNTMNVRCMDKLIIANRTKGTFNFEQKTPNQIAKEVFESVGLTCGWLESGSPIDRRFDQETIYKMALIAYKLENEKTGVPYIIRMNEGKVDVVEKGKIVAKYELQGDNNLFDSTYRESSENMVSKVIMYDSEGKPIGEIEGAPGGAVEMYKQEQGEDPKARAEALLKGLEREAKVRVRGDFDLITGNAVYVREKFTGLTGKFYIDSDTHTFSKNYHVVDLTLAFENMMEEVDTSVQEKPEAESSNGIGGTGSSVPNDGSAGARAIQAGLKVRGTRYLWGGNNPSRGGVDCSGFVDYAYTAAGMPIPGRLTSAGLRSNPRAYGFVEVPFSQRKPGDVLWQSGHVALQYYNGQILESGGTSKRIMGYSGVAITGGKGRRFNKAYRYVGK